MKKIIIILLSIFILSGCDQLSGYWAYITGRTAGTTQTVFEFSVDSNDSVSTWYIDGQVLNRSIARSTTGDSLQVSFDNPGIHTIEVITENGASDKANISISLVDTFFNISAYYSDTTTEFYLNYPILTIDETDYDVEKASGLSVTEYPDKNVINLNIFVDQQDSFLFVNNNAFNLHGIDLTCMTADDMHDLMFLLFPERYIEPIPAYSDTRYNLSGYNGTVSDILTVYGDRLIASDRILMFEDNSVYMNDIRKINLYMFLDNKDSFLFINGNMIDFFGIDLTDMSYEEFVVSSDILNRYPEEGLIELMEVY